MRYQTSEQQIIRIKGFGVMPVSSNRDAHESSEILKITQGDDGITYEVRINSNGHLVATVAPYEEGAEMNKEIMIEQLEEALSELKGIEGVSKVSHIINDLEMHSFLKDSLFPKEITVISNKRFELTIKREEVVFSTSFSNQKITPEYMNEMMLIDQKKDMIYSCILSLMEMKEQA